MTKRDGVVDLVAAICGDQLQVDLDDHGGPRLPVIEGADGFPEPAQIFVVAGSAGVIMAPSVRIEAEPLLQVHLIEVQGTTAGRSMISLEDLGRLDHPLGVEEAITGGVAEFRGDRPWPARRPAWFAPTWLGEVDAWVDEILGQHGLRRDGPAEVIKLWSLSAVLRIPARGGDGPESVFFKAACDWFRAEPTVTELINRLVPGVAPDLLSCDADRAWMLMRAFGRDGAERDPVTAVPAAQALARLQIAMADHVDEALQIGVPDRRLAATLRGLSMIISDSVELGTLNAEERAAARDMEPWLADQVMALATDGLPYSIGHGDFHLGNITVSNGAVIIYDWTDAAVTFPVLDAALLARSVSDPPDQSVLTAYADVWREGYPAELVERSIRLAPLVNRIYQAISYEGIYRAQEERTRWELGGVVASTLRSLAQDWTAARDAGWQRGHQ